MLLAIDMSVTGGTATVVLRGEFDTVTAPGLAEQLLAVLDQHPHVLVFDMHAVTFMDCAAVRVLAQTARRLPGGATPVIRKPRPQVRSLLRAVGFETTFRFE